MHIDRKPLISRISWAGVLAIGTATAGPALASGNSNNVALLGRLTLQQLGSTGATDCWGYTSASGREYAIMGLLEKTSIIEITDPTNPQIVGAVSHTRSLADAKVYLDYVYVSNGAGGGIDIIDLSNVDNGQVRLVRRMTTGGVQRVHNIAINEDSGYLYLAIGNINSGKITAFNLADPENPVIEGFYPGDRAHDLEIINYTEGPFAGREIAFSFSEGRGLDIVDVTDKSNMFLLSRSTYPNLRYCHQGWVSADRQFLYLDDELDNIQRTTVFDISDLENPVFLADFSASENATDHNLYIRDGFVFEANYKSGLRIFDLNQDPVAPPEVGFFDTSNQSGTGFAGAWTAFPFFPSGVVIVSDREEGLFVLDPSEAVGGTSATLTDLTMIDGFPVAGGLPELEASDDTYFSTLALETGKASETHRLLYRVRALTTVQNPTTIDITLEGHILDIEATVTLLLRNVNTGLFEAVGQFTNVFGNDTTNTVNVPNAARFVRPNGRIVLRVKKVIILPLTVGEGFPSFDDLLEIRVR